MNNGVYVSKWLSFRRTARSSYSWDLILFNSLTNVSSRVLIIFFCVYIYIRAHAHKHALMHTNTHTYWRYEIVLGNTSLPIWYTNNSNVMPRWRGYITLHKKQATLGKCAPYWICLVLMNKKWDFKSRLSLTKKKLNDFHRYTNLHCLQL